jgi:hypothetical protein
MMSEPPARSVWQVAESLKAMRLSPVYRPERGDLLFPQTQEARGHAFEEEIRDGRSLGFQLSSLLPKKTVVLEHLFVTCSHVDEECQSSSRVMFRCVLDTLARGDESTEGLAQELNRQRETLEQHRFNLAFLLNQGNIELTLLNILLNEMPVAPMMEPPHSVRLQPHVKYRFDGETPEKLISLAFVFKNPGLAAVPINLLCGSYAAHNAMRISMRMRDPAIQFETSSGKTR